MDVSFSPKVTVRVEVVGSWEREKIPNRLRKAREVGYWVSVNRKWVVIADLGIRWNSFAGLNNVYISSGTSTTYSF